MKEIIKFVKIPDHLKDIIGVPDSGTRMYRQFGDDAKMELWWDAICEITRGSHVVSPGGAASFVGVTRAAVHKRIKEGRLTAFVFYKLTKSKLLKLINIDYEKLADFGQPSIIFIPWNELHYWRDYMKERKDKNKALKEAKAEGHKNDNFLRGNSKWKELKRKKS